MMWASTSSASSRAHAFSAQRLPGMLLPACSWSLDYRTNLVLRLTNGLSSTRSGGKLIVFYQFPSPVGEMRNDWHRPML